MQVVPAFNEFEDGKASFSLGTKRVLVEEFAFEGCKETLCHRIVIISPESKR